MNIKKKKVPNKKEKGAYNSSGTPTEYRRPDISYIGRSRRGPDFFLSGPVQFLAGLLFPD